jgi:hypothetical protein
MESNLIIVDRICGDKIQKRSRGVTHSDSGIEIAPIAGLVPEGPEDLSIDSSRRVLVLLKLLKGMTS